MPSQPNHWPRKGAKRREKRQKKEPMIDSAFRASSNASVATVVTGFLRLLRFLRQSPWQGIPRGSRGFCDAVALIAPSSTKWAIINSEINVSSP